MVLIKKSHVPIQTTQARVAYKLLEVHPERYAGILSDVLRRNRVLVRQGIMCHLDYLHEVFEKIPEEMLEDPMIASTLVRRDVGLFKRLPLRAQANRQVIKTLMLNARPHQVKDLPLEYQFDPEIFRPYTYNWKVRRAEWKEAFPVVTIVEAQMIAFTAAARKIEEGPASRLTEDLLWQISVTAMEQLEAEKVIYRTEYN